MAKKQEEKISIFGQAKVKTSGTKPKDDKEVIYIDGLEPKLLELEFLKAQIKDLEAQLGGVADEIKNISKEKFVELYKSNKSNPNTFLIKDGEGCVMVIPTDKYISIKDEDRANQLIDEYGDDIISVDEKYYFNPQVLERNMEAIERLIMDAKTISNEDKKNLLVKEVKYSISKGYIDKLAQYGNKIDTVLNDIQPIITLKNCGGKMEEGGMMGDDFIANVYEKGSVVVGGYKYQIDFYGTAEDFDDEGYAMSEGAEVIEFTANNDEEAIEYATSNYADVYSVKNITTGKLIYEDGSVVGKEPFEIKREIEFEYGRYIGEIYQEGLSSDIIILTDDWSTASSIAKKYNGDIIETDFEEEDNEYEYAFKVIIENSEYYNGGGVGDNVGRYANGGGISFLNVNSEVVSKKLFQDADLIKKNVSNYVSDMVEKGVTRGQLVALLPNYNGYWRVDIGDGFGNYDFKGSDDELKEVAELIREGNFSGSNPKFTFGANVWNNKEEKSEYEVSGTVWYVTDESAGDDYNDIFSNVLTKDEFDDYFSDGKIEKTRFRIKAKYQWQIKDKIYAEMAKNDEERELDYEQGRYILGYKILTDNQDSGFDDDLPYEVEEDEDDDNYEGSGFLGGDDDTELDIIYLKYIVPKEKIKEFELFLNELSEKYFYGYSEELENQGYDLDNLFNVSTFSNLDSIKISISVPKMLEDDMDSEVYNKFGDLIDSKFEGGGFLGGIFGGGRTYKKGLAYKLDRAKHNKSEDWEVPMKNRKKRYANGDIVEKYIIEDKNGTFMILNTETNMYVDRAFDTKQEAEYWKKEKDFQRKTFGRETNYAGGGGVGTLAKEIEIVAISQSGTRGYRIYDVMTNRRAINKDGSYEFDDSEISEIIGEKNMDAFYDGQDKFKPKKKLNFDIYAGGGGVGENPKYDELYRKANNNVQGALELYASELGIYNMFYGHKVDANKKAKVKRLQTYLENKYSKTYAGGGGVGKGEYKYGIFTISEDGEELGHIFFSDNPDLENDPYGDDVPVSVGSNQLVRRFANGGGVEQVMTDEMCVMQSCVNGEIHCDMLEEIIGSKPEYPYQQVGSIKLQKCYLRPYYKIS